jgi:hypothetical protein
MRAEFHLQKNAPNEHWPNGAWSLYQITGEQIAERTIWTATEVEGQRHRKYEIAERWPWPGYVGMFTTLAEATAEIERLTTA